MGQGYCIVDLGSTNGTFVNEQRLAPNSPQNLNPNDIIRIGDTRYTFEAQGAALPGTVFDVPQANPAYLPTIAAAPPMMPPMQSAPPVPPAQASPYPDVNAPPAYMPPQAAPYNPTMAAPSYTAYQQSPGAPPPAYSPYEQVAPQAAPYYQASPYGQAAAPQPYGQASPKKFSVDTYVARFKTDSRFRLYVIGAGVALLLIIGGIVVASQSASTPTKTLTNFCNDYKAGNFASAYNELSNNQQSQETQSQFVTAQQAAVNQVGGVTSCTVSNVNENDPSATGTVVFTLGDGQTVTQNYKLVDQNGTWKIDNATAT